VIRSYTGWYLAMAGRVAERWLVALGDEDWVRERQQQQQAKDC
jgi:hypothetical protein